MRKLFTYCFYTFLFLVGLLVLPGLAGAAESDPETCPANPASPDLPESKDLAVLVGMWALDTVDGSDPQQAVAVQFLGEGQALLYIGAAVEPVGASYGMNCCGDLVLSPTDTSVVPTIVAPFETTDTGLILFAAQGDWVFTRLDTGAGTD
ncbi:MAG: hypothetical protein AAGC44_08220 [Planctomycetota bacterium]